IALPLASLKLSVLCCEAFTVRPLGTASPPLRQTAPDGLIFWVGRESGHGFAIGGKFQELLRRGHRPPSRLSTVSDSERPTGAEVPDLLQHRAAFLALPKQRPPPATVFAGCANQLVGLDYRLLRCSIAS